MKEITIRYERIEWPDEIIYEGTVILAGGGVIPFMMNEYTRYYPFESKVDFSPPMPEEKLQRVIKKYILEREEQYKEGLGD